MSLHTSIICLLLLTLIINIMYFGLILTSSNLKIRYNAVKLYSWTFHDVYEKNEQLLVSVSESSSSSHSCTIPCALLWCMLANLCCWISRCCFLHFILRFWNQTLTWYNRKTSDLIFVKMFESKWKVSSKCIAKNEIW